MNVGKLLRYFPDLSDADLVPLTVSLVPGTGVSVLLKDRSVRQDWYSALVKYTVGNGLPRPPVVVGW